MYGSISSCSCSGVVKEVLSWVAAVTSCKLDTGACQRRYCRYRLQAQRFVLSTQLDAPIHTPRLHVPTHAIQCLDRATGHRHWRLAHRRLVETPRDDTTWCCTDLNVVKANPRPGRSDTDPATRWCTTGDYMQTPIKKQRPHGSMPYDDDSQRAGHH